MGEKQTDKGTEHDMETLGPFQGLIGKYGSFPKLWVPFWGPYNKDFSILGSI